VADLISRRLRASLHRSRNQVRPQWRCEYRVSGAGRWSYRFGLRDGLGLSSRILLEGTVVRPFSPTPRLIFTVDSLRQTRHGTLRPGPGFRAPIARTPDG